MARKPRDEASKPATPAEIETPAASVPPAKPKSAISIDLPASAVSEVKPDEPVAMTGESEAGNNATTRGTPADDHRADAAAEGAPSAGPEQPVPNALPERGWLAPALVALVAGIGGGFLGYEIREFARPKAIAPEALMTRLGEVERRIASQGSAADPAAVIQPLAERLQKAEGALAEAGGREAALREEIGKLRAALAKESADRASAIAALPRAPAIPGTGVAPAEIEALRGQVEGLRPRLDQVAGNMDALAKRVANAPASDALARANARLAATNLIEDAFVEGRPLARMLDVLGRIGVEPARLQPFAPFAEAGAPGARALADSLRAIKPAKPAAAAAPADSGLTDRLWASARSLVEVRRTGEITGTDDAAHLARAEQALARGDIDLAVTLVGRLSAGLAADYAGWLSRAKQRQAAGTALQGLKNDALAALAAAAR
jgi:hypothetical protein